MKAHSIWMPFYTGDYMKDTIHLTNAEHGAYCRSIFYYWNKGEPLTSKELWSICGKEVDTVSAFYIEDKENGLWHHRRIDEELTKAVARFESARERSLKGVSARLDKMRQRKQR